MVEKKDFLKISTCKFFFSSQLVLKLLIGMI